MKKAKKYLLGIMVLMVFFAAWEISSRLQWVNPLFIPPFTKILGNTYNMFRYKSLLYDMAVSVGRAAAGTVLAAAIGIPLGFFLALPYRSLRTALGSFAGVLSQINPFVLFHILILFLGIGNNVKITIIVWAAMWPVVFNTTAAVEGSDRLLIKMGRALGGGKIQFFFRILLPAAAPGIFPGIRIGAGYSLFMLIAAEMMGGKSGLGWQILNYQSSFQIENIFSVAFVIAMLGVLFDLFILGIQRMCIQGQTA